MCWHLMVKLHSIDNNNKKKMLGVSKEKTQIIYKKLQMDIDFLWVNNRSLNMMK